MILHSVTWYYMNNDLRIFKVHEICKAPPIFSQHNHRFEVVPHLDLPSDWQKNVVLLNDAQTCASMMDHLCICFFQNTGAPE